MRSCEYSKVDVRGKTKLLTVRNINFSDKLCRPVNKRDPDLENRAHYVSVTFPDQKNNHKSETRTQQTTDDMTLNPVRGWARTITRILSSPGTDEDTPVNFFFDKTAKITQQKKFFSQQNTNHILRATCQLKPDMHFGYKPCDIGSHSIRSGAAMSLFLADDSVHKIMILGRWSSDAFLAYIRPQVQEWTSGMSANMLLHEDFHVAPHATGAVTNNKNNKADKEDPRIRNDPRAQRGSSNSLLPFNGSKALSFVIPRLHLFH
jgi:hypothetical protein